MMDNNINPLDLLSGKVAQNEFGTYWFKEAGNNFIDGYPIIDNVVKVNWSTFNKEDKEMKEYHFNILKLRVEDFINKNPDEFVGMCLIDARRMLMIELLDII